jgi:ABC-type sugar transport system substrate-binding protein
MPRPWAVLALTLVLGASCAPTRDETGGSGGAAAVSIGVMPKLVGIDYFNACERGAQEAAAELGVDLTYDGPVTNDVTKQAEMLDAWITRRFDVIAVAPNDPHALAPTLKRAAAQGIQVLTWDADSDADSRAYFVNQAPLREFGHTLVEVMAEQIGGAGEVAIVTGSLTAANQNAWMEYMREAVSESYPEMEIVTVKPSEEDQQLAFQVTLDLLKAYPDLKGIFGITTVAAPGAAEAVRQAGRSGEVAVTGVSTPNQMRPYVEDGTVREFVLWNPIDLGYLTVYAGKLLHERGTLPPTFEAGRLGEITVRGTEVLLGPPVRFNADNIAEFDF